MCSSSEQDSIEAEGHAFVSLNEAARRFALAPGPATARTYQEAIKETARLTGEDVEAVAEIAHKVVQRAVGLNHMKLSNTS